MPDSSSAWSAASEWAGVWMLCSQAWSVVMPESIASARPKLTDAYVSSA